MSKGVDWTVVLVGHREKLTVLVQGFQRATQLQMRVRPVNLARIHWRGTVRTNHTTQTRYSRGAPIQEC